MWIRSQEAFNQKKNSQDVLKALKSTKFLEILHSNKTPNKFLSHQLKHPSFVREAF